MYEQSQTPPRIYDLTDSDDSNPIGNGGAGGSEATTHAIDPVALIEDALQQNLGRIAKSATRAARGDLALCRQRAIEKVTEFVVAYGPQVRHARVNRARRTAQKASFQDRPIVLQQLTNLVGAEADAVSDCHRQLREQMANVERVHERCSRQFPSAESSTVSAAALRQMAEHDRTRARAKAEEIVRLEALLAIADPIAELLRRAALDVMALSALAAEDLRVLQAALAVAQRRAGEMLNEDYEVPRHLLRLRGTSRGVAQFEVQHRIALPIGAFRGRGPEDLAAEMIDAVENSIRHDNRSIAEAFSQPQLHARLARTKLDAGLKPAARLTMRVGRPLVLIEKPADVDLPETLLPEASVHTIDGDANVLRVSAFSLGPLPALDAYTPGDPTENCAEPHRATEVTAIQEALETAVRPVRLHEETQGDEYAEDAS